MHAHRRLRVISSALRPAPSAVAAYPSSTLQDAGAPLTEVSPKVIYAIKGKIAIIAINRPQVMNACDFETYAAISTALRRFDEDDGLAVAIFTGVGERAFCAGSDIKSNFAGGGIDKLDREAGASAGAQKAEAQPQKAESFGIGKCRKVVIAAINGHCNGGGLEQAIACDIRVAVRSAQFGMGEVRLGLLPGGGGTQRLPRLIPKGRAIEMLATGQRIGAEEALRLGLVDHLVDSLDGLMPRALEIAEQVALSAPLAVQTIKRVAMAGLDMRLEDGLHLEAEGQRFLYTTEDSREGTNAFAEKRAPRWRGR